MAERFAMTTPGSFDSSAGRRLGVVLAIGLGLLGVFAAAEGLRPGAGDWFALGFILCAGFPHGAGDLFTLRRLGVGGRAGGLPTLALYLAAMGLTAALWWAWPAGGLLAFVLVSLLHFGQDQAASLGLGGRALWGYAVPWGTFVLGAPLVWHPDTLQPVLAEMLGFTPPDYWLGAAVGAVTGMGSVALALALRNAFTDAGPGLARRWRCEVVLILVLAAAYLILPGLWGFAIFFLAVHATTSIVNQVQWEGAPLNAEAVATFLRRGLPYAVLAVVSILALIAVGPGLEFGPVWLARFFILVSVFTTPHAAVIYLAEVDARTDSTPG